MKIINFFRLMGLSKTTSYIIEPGSNDEVHPHDSTDGCELLDETLHMKDQPFEEDEDQDYASIF